MRVTTDILPEIAADRTAVRHFASNQPINVVVYPQADQSGKVNVSGNRGSGGMAIVSLQI